MATLIDWSQGHYKPETAAWCLLQRRRDWHLSENCGEYEALARGLEAACGYARQPNMTDGFWLEHRSEGRMDCVIAARLYSLSESSLQDELPRMMPGATCDAPTAAAIFGQVCFAGGLWVRPDCRKQGLGAEAFRTLVAAALVLWNPDYIVGVAEKSLEAFNRAEGFRRLEPTVRWRHWDMNLGVMDRTEALRLVGGVGAR